MGNQIFNKKDIKTFNWQILDGKTIKIHTTILEGVYCAIGEETETGTLYLLAMCI